MTVRINLTSVLVDDQDKALKFYTEVLGFTTKHDIPMGEHRWITVVSPDDPDGTELVLEPDSHPAVRPFKEALASDGIPFTSFAVDDVAAEFARLQALGGAIHPGARRHGGAGHHCGPRRHLWQPDPDRPPGRLSARPSPGWPPPQRCPPSWVSDTWMVTSARCLAMSPVSRTFGRPPHISVITSISR